MTEQTAVVVALEGDHARVRVDGSGCGRCHEAGGCGGHNLGRMFCAADPEFRVLNPRQAQVGEQVTLVIAKGTVTQSANLAYALPLGLLLLGAGLGQWLAGDLLAIFGGGAGLFLGWLALRRQSLAPLEKSGFAPYIR